MSKTFNVLFLCTHNAARSIMAEAILSRIGRDRFNVYSAGNAPAEAPLPEVMHNLQVLGHDTAGLRSKSWSEFTGPDAPAMDFVIALCDTTEDQVCPELGDKAMTASWPLPDPAKFTGTEVEKGVLLNQLYSMILRRLEIFCSLPISTLDKMALKARLDEIGDSVPGAA